MVKGFTQQLGLDYIETFSLIIKPQIIHLVLKLLVSHHWQVHQLDVQNAFLHDDLIKSVFISQPKGFIHHTFPIMSTN